MPASRREHRATQARRRRFLFLGVLGTVVLILLGWRIQLFWHGPWTRSAAAVSESKIDVLTKLIETTDRTHQSGIDRLTILIMGTDARPGEPGRSDTMMLAFVDLKQGNLNLLSLPRDSYAHIPGHGWNKISHAYAYGTSALGQKAVENLIGIPIDYTLVINMQGFEKIVDAVGGVDIFIEADMYYEDPYDDPPLLIDFKQGQQHLGGMHALHYVRFRSDVEDDWGRMKRQHTFLTALMQAAKKPANLTRLPQVLQLALDTVDTDLSPSQMTRIALVAKEKLTDQGITGDTLSGDDLWTPHGYYLALHFTEMRRMIRELSGGSNDPTAQTRDAEDAAEYRAALPQGSSVP